MVIEMKQEQAPRANGLAPSRSEEKAVAKGKIHAHRRVDADRIEERAARIDRTHARVRERYPWGKMLNFYLAPYVVSPQAEPRWPRLQDVADNFGVPLQVVKVRSAKYGWTSKQAEAEDNFWRERNDAVMRYMNRRFVQSCGLAFVIAARSLSKILELMDRPLSVRELCDLLRANKIALETTFMAAGLAPSKTPIAPCVPIMTDPRGQPEEACTIDSKYY